jgi:hypothetical protein
MVNTVESDKRLYRVTRSGGITLEPIHQEPDGDIYELGDGLYGYQILWDDTEPERWFLINHGVLCRKEREIV